MDPRFDESGSTWISSSAAEQIRTIKATPGKLFELMVTNVAAGTRYVWVFDNTTDSGSLLFPPVALGVAESLFLRLQGPRTFGTGCTVASSTGINVYAAGGADFRMTALYK